MKNRAKILAGVLPFVALTTFAQESTPAPKPIKRMAIQEFYVQPGLLMQVSNNSSFADFQKLAPQSTLLKTNLTGYNQSSGRSFDADAMLSILMGIHFSDKQKTAYKKGTTLRLGVSYLAGSNLVCNFNQSQNKRYDTLTSSQGQVIYRDSVVNRSLNMNYRSQQLRLDASLIFRTNPEARWSLYTGVGITAGVSLNSTTDISYYSFGGLSDYDINTPGNYYSNYHYSGSIQTKTEHYRNSSSIGVSAYVPMGVDFRLGRKREFWKRTHLFYEVRPGVSMTSISEVGNFTNATIQQGLGLRVTWN